MSFVKTPGSPHVAVLCGLVFAAVKTSFDDGDWDGLRQSHFRLMSNVPDEGIGITELAERLGMSKQGCGQFVAPLGEAGYLRIDRDPGDGRARIVRRTARADAVLIRVEAQIAEVERGWAEQVGPERYADFRQVMLDLVGDLVPAGYRSITAEPLSVS